MRYEFPNRPVARALARVLPDSARHKISWLRPETTITARSAFPNEPLLSLAFSARDVSGRPLRPGTRVVVLDDCDQRFDGVLNYLANQGVFEIMTFPRRGRELRLRLMDGESTVPVGEFKIRNPCPGPHPVWNPAPLPLTVTNDTLEITLQNFVADAAARRTRCVLKVRENGQDNAAWLPSIFEISDATGNHWRAPMDRPPQVTNGQITASFFGALWPDEDAWKLRVEFKPADKQAPNQGTRLVEFLARPQQVR